MKETPIVKSLLEILAINGVLAWRINSGQVFTQKGHIYRGAPAGTSDIVGIIPIDGRFLAIEVKTPKNKNNVSDYQENFLNAVNKAKGVAFVAWDAESLKEGLNKFNYKIAI